MAEGARDGLTGRTLSGLGWTVSSTGVQTALQFGVNVVMARLIAPSEFGLLGVAMIIVSVGSALSMAGIGPAIVQRKVLTERHLGTGLTLSFVLGLIFMGLVWVMAEPISAFFENGRIGPVVRLISLVFVLNAVSVPAVSLIQRRMEFSKLFRVEAVATLVGYCLVGITLALMGYGVWALCWANLAYNLVRAVGAQMSSPERFLPSFHLVEARDLLSFGVAITLSKLTIVAVSRVDSFFVGKFLGAETLGLYLRSFEIIDKLTNKFSQIVHQVMFPVYSEVQGDHARLRRGYLRALSLVTFFAAPVLMGLAGVAGPFVIGVFGEAWAGSVLPLRLLALGCIFRLDFQLSTSVVMAKGAVYRQFLQHLINAFMIAASAYWGLRWGIAGVAGLIALSYLIMFLMVETLVARLIEVGIGDFVRAQAGGIFLGALYGGLCYLTSERLWGLGIHGVFVTVLSMGFSGVVAICAVYASPAMFLGKEGHWLLETVAQKVPRVRRAAESLRRRY